MKKLVLAMMVAVSLVSCNTRQSHVPADWVGSWFSADGGWQCSLFEDVVLYQNDVWQYQSVTETDSTLNLTITNNGRKVELGFIGRPASRKAKLDDGSIMTIRGLGVFVARYSVNGHSEGCVLKNSVNAAVVMCPYWDSVYKTKSPVRVEPKMPVPDGTIGTAVVRLYLRNSFRGPQSVENLDRFLSNDCYVLFDNRLEVSLLKMQLVETDRFGKMFEATIPVDGMANFSFSESKSWAVSLPHDESAFGGNDETLGIRTRSSYLAAQGDTVMVVIDHTHEGNSRERGSDYFYYNDYNYYGGLGNLYPLTSNIVIDGVKYVGRKGPDFGDENAALTTMTNIFDSLNAMIDQAKRMAPAYSRYYSYTANRVRYILADYALQYSEKQNVSARYKKFIADNFPVTDSCILQSRRSIDYGMYYAGIKHVVLSKNSNNIPESTMFLDADAALSKGLSQTAVDLLLTRKVAQWLSNNAVRIERMDIDTIELEKLIAEVKTPSYHSYLENLYKVFRTRRSYVDRIFDGEKLTDDEFAEYERITDSNVTARLRDVQDNLANYDYALPRVEYKDGPGTYYLYDSEYPNVAIDSMYSPSGHYIFHRNLKVGRSYIVRYKNEDGKVQERTSFFIDNAGFDGRTRFVN